MQEFSSDEKFHLQAKAHNSSNHFGRYPLDEKIAVLDLETTGFQPEKDYIVEIGVCELDLKSGVVTKLFDSLILETKNFIHPNKWIFSHSSLTLRQVQSRGKWLQTLSKKIQHNIFDRYFITTFNIGFDRKFLELRGFKVAFATDIMELARKYLQCSKNPSVQECMIKILKTSFREPHRAYQDAIIEARILWKILNGKTRSEYNVLPIDIYHPSFLSKSRIAMDFPNKQFELVELLDFLDGKQGNLACILCGVSEQDLKFPPYPKFSYYREIISSSEIILQERVEFYHQYRDGVMIAHLRFDHNLLYRGMPEYPP